MKLIKKKITLTIIYILCLLVLLLVGYLLHVLLSYNRLEDNIIINVENTSAFDEINIDGEYNITTYNIGFGAYSQNYSFFMDKGVTLDDVKVSGKYAKARSKDEVLFNTNGAIKTIVSLNPDFCLFQEVDTYSTRSYFVDQYQMIKDNFNTYNSTFGINFHSTFLAYPLNDMIGRINGGIATVSKYKIYNSVRHSFTVAKDLSKLFDLDRCFVSNEFKTSDGNTLVIVNVHMSAYDEGGLIKEQQLKELNSYLKEVKEKGFYVIIGGDYNHDLLTYNPSFNYNYDNRPYTEYISHKHPEWLQHFFNTDYTHNIENGFRIATSDNAPTYRDACVEWEIGNGYVSNVDGFIVSDNIEIVGVKTIITKNGNKDADHFAFSDHDPVLLTFRFKQNA